MRNALLVALLLLSAAPIFAAEEPSGCDKFKWPIEHERAALTAPDRVKLTSGSELATVPATGMTFVLVAPAEARLPSLPERAPKDGTFAGFARFRTVPKSGIYTISLSVGAWIDVVQDGHALRPKGFSGATDCDGIRKTMKYELSANPFVLQISGARDNAVSVAILPSE
ncbi:MAG: hypothetical protein KGL35_20360 [Bradyrhizobium sp.]|uniref:hypothetical protein n=1 Tax=Bradyrhizobium sp. TaxID=376 RepID=UPI001C296CEA|nr:hypothetical protein [Bradyrhizobium sp.]MBU6463709.1 hypothetical protein [Pseudomonadota bacterium]MDE2068638.1 hypothetical protein [Bradyrhizobium sp.]MDE2471027.1 hypothetical protein [Bradyrhizobium sp.]